MNLNTIRIPILMHPPNMISEIGKFKYNFNGSIPNANP